MRLVFIALAAFMGFYGIAIGIFIYALMLAKQKSFGVPFLSPKVRDIVRLHDRNILS